MKKLISLMLAAVMLLTMFAACGKDPSGGGEQGSGEQGGSADSNAKVGDVLDAPEKTVSIEDLKEMTIHASISVSSSKTERTMVYAISNSGAVPRYFEKSTTVVDQTPIYQENLCLITQDGALGYTRMSDSGDYSPIDRSGQFGSNDGYFHYNLANFGIGYEKWLKTDGFTKREDAVCQDRECYVYDVEFTDTMSETQFSAVIYVDKETGLWIKQEGTASTGMTFTRAIESIEQNASVIPGSQIVTIAEQVIYDDNGIVITAKKLDCYDPSGTVLLTLETKNASSSDVQISSHYFDVNGLCLGGSVLSYSCAAGETKETELKLSSTALELSGIEVIKDMALSLRIENVHTETTGDGDHTVVDSVLEEKTEELTIKTDHPSDHVQPVNKEGTVLIDTDDIYLVLCSFEVQMDGSAIFKAYCENKLDQPIRTTIDIKTINGIAYDDYDKISMQENSEGFDGFWIWSDFLKNNDIQRIESVEFTYEVFMGESFVGSERVTEESEVIRVEFGQ